MFQIKKFFYIESIQDLDFDYIKKKGCLQFAVRTNIKTSTYYVWAKDVRTLEFWDLKILFKLKLFIYLHTTKNPISIYHLSINI